MEVKVIGQTHEHEGNVIIFTTEDMPPDSVVLFISKEEWEKIKPDVKIVS